MKSRINIPSYRVDITKAGIPESRPSAIDKLSRGIKWDTYIEEKYGNNLPPLLEKQSTQDKI